MQFINTYVLNHTYIYFEIKLHLFNSHSPYYILTMAFEMPIIQGVQKKKKKSKMNE